MSEPTTPPTCEGCSLHGVGRGFVPDSGDFEKAKYLLCFEAPGQQEIIFQMRPIAGRGFFETQQECDAEIARRKKAMPDVPINFLRQGAPIVGPTGFATQRWILDRVGIKREDCAIMNVLRCLPPRGKTGDPYPTGEARKVAEAHCFDENTSVLLSNGKWKLISRMRTGDHVRTLDDRGNFSVNSVEERIKIPRSKETSWVEVVVNGRWGRGAARWGNPGVTCTADHIWYGPQGGQRADQLTKGDPIFLPRYGNSDLIFGTILGDGYVRPSGFLSISHANYAWAKHKADHFGVPLRPKIVHLNGKDFQQWEMIVGVPKRWRSVFYRNKQKLWHPPSDAALAVWYCDDGFLIKTRQGKFAAGICLQAFSLQTQNLIVRWATSKFGRATKLKSGVLRIPIGFADAFFLSIEQFVVPSMYYKLPPMFAGHYSGWLEEKVPQIGWVDRVIKKRTVDSAQYCLVVPKEKNFFTRCGLVSNCRRYDRVAEFNPNTIVVTLHPASVIREVTPLPLVVKDMEKVRDFTVQGRRVMTLLGGKAAFAFLRYAANVTRWRGTYQALTEDWVSTYKSMFDYTRKKRKEPKVMMEGVCGKKHKGKKKGPTCGYLGCVENFQRRTDAAQTAKVPV